MATPTDSVPDRDPAGQSLGSPGSARHARFSQALAVRAHLPLSWPAFFARHGDVLPVQAAAIPVILGGGDVLVCAPTAGGKTEAVAAPLLERALTQKWAPLAIAMVSPTRALVNDLYRRLQGPLAALGATLGRRTSDHRERVADKPPLLLLTTPESIDSLLVRHPQALVGLRALVLDEIHCLHGGPRGDQLAVLVARLRKLTAEHAPHGTPALQVVALSATLADPVAVAQRYLHDGQVLRVPGQRAIHATLGRFGAAETFAPLLADSAVAQNARKVLVFVNRRQDVEAIAVALRGRLPFGENVFAHHGSLRKAERERTEQAFLDAGRAVCVATTTLELGIDIGDIDLIALADPPADVQSFLQRIGRGNRRRRDGCRVLLGWRSEGLLELQRFLLQSAQRGELHGDLVPFRPSILVQQALSLLYQNPQRFVTVRALRARLPGWLAAAHADADLQALLDQAAATGWLHAVFGQARYGVTDASERLFERGELHGNLASEPAGVEVVDDATGAVLGQVGGGTLVQPGDKLTFGGRTHKVAQAGAGRVRVQLGAKGQALPIFAPRGRPVVAGAQARAFADYLGLAPTEAPVLPLSGGACLFHFRGSLVGEVLAAFASHTLGAGQVRAGGYSLVYTGCDAVWRPPTLGELQAILAHQAARLWSVLQPGPFANAVPAALVERWLAEALDLPALVKDLATLTACDAGARAQVLAGLVGR